MKKGEEGEEEEEEKEEEEEEEGEGGKRKEERGTRKEEKGKRSDWEMAIGLFEVSNFIQWDMAKPCCDVVFFYLSIAWGN